MNFKTNLQINDVRRSLRMNYSKHSCKQIFTNWSQGAFQWMYVISPQSFLLNTDMLYLNFDECNQNLLYSNYQIAKIVI